MRDGRDDRMLVSAIGCVMLLGMAKCTPARSRSTPVHSVGDAAGTVPFIDSVRPDSVIVLYGGVVEVTLTAVASFQVSPEKTRCISTMQR